MTLEQYLRNATKGLFGKKKLEVRAEIEGNIREMALEYQIAGMSESEAISRAILEFGEARVLNAEMVKVHTMPKMIKGALLVGLISSVALVGVSSSLAEILTSSVGPYPTCQEIFYKNKGVGACSPEAAWMKLSDFANDVTKAGGIFTTEKTGFIVTFPNDIAIDVPFDPSPDQKISENSTMKGDVFFEKENESWIDLTRVINSIAENSTLPITLEGWENPKLHVGKTTLQLVTGTDITAAFYTYAFGVMDELQRRGFGVPVQRFFTFNLPVLGSKADLAISNSHKFKHQILVNDKPGTIYAVLTQKDAFDDPVSISIAPVALNRTISVWLDSKTVDFVDTLEQMDWHFRTADSPAVLMKLSGRLDFRAPKMEIVVPPTKQSTSK